MLRHMPALTRFTYGALNPLTVDHYTLRELSEYLTSMQRMHREMEESGGR